MACSMVEGGNKNYIDYDLEYKYSLMVVGLIGAGKSTFCNFILGEKRFKETSGLTAGTGSVEQCVIPYKGGDVLVVDCPGFCDPKRTADEIIEEICKIATLCRGGMDAIGIVMDPTSRFTETQKCAYDQMEYFGVEFWKHAFIIFNREKDILEDFDLLDARERIDEMKNDPDCPEIFKLIMEKVDNRYICVESKKRRKDEVYRQGVKDNVLAVILQLKENNQGKYFNSFMEQARRRFERLADKSTAIEAEIAALRADNAKMGTARIEMEKSKIEMEKAKIEFERQVREMLERERERESERESERGRRCTILWNPTIDSLPCYSCISVTWYQ